MWPSMSRWRGSAGSPLGWRRRRASGHSRESSTRYLVDLRFDNRSKRGVDLVVALLLEDERGAPLQRLNCPEVHLGGGKAREFRHALTAPGDALLAARRVYLFLQVE